MKSPPIYSWIWRYELSYQKNDSYVFIYYGSIINGLVNFCELMNGKSADSATLALFWKFIFIYFFINYTLVLSCNCIESAVLRTCSSVSFAKITEWIKNISNQSFIFQLPLQRINNWSKFNTEPADDYHRHPTYWWIPGNVKLVW